MSLEDKVDKMDKKLDQVLNYLNDDPYTKRKGLVSQVDQNTNEINEEKNKRKIKNAKVSVIAWVGSAIISLGAWLIKLLWE